MSEHARNQASQCRAVGTAVILDFDYLGVIYEVRDFSHSEAWLKGAKEPPKGDFGVLLHLSDRFFECRASSLHASKDNHADWVIEIVQLLPPSFLQQPASRSRSLELVGAGLGSPNVAVPLVRPEQKVRTRKTLYHQDDREVIIEKRPQFRRMRRSS